MNIDIIITQLSWEERYILGLEKNIQNYSPEIVVLLKSTNPNTELWKKENYDKTRMLVKCELIEIELDLNDSPKNWYALLKLYSRFTNKSILLDITTMTREVLWISFYNCKIFNYTTYYIYFSPLEYPSTWVTRNPGKPRLLYKMSGIAKLSKPTLLLVTCGYDIERIDNLIYSFEPMKTMVFLADGKSERNIANSEEAKQLLNKKYNISLFYEYDPYRIDYSLDLIIKALLKLENGTSYLDNYNIIFNSLGPKTSAITLYKFWLKFPSTALSYIPSKEYNKNYSKGIGEPIFDSLLF